MIPTYIEERIRRTVPPNSCIVHGSTPVISFGNSRSAQVATLGLNPSRLEFCDQRGCELVGSSRRLATHASLGTTDLSSAPVDVIAQVLADCNSYFHRNPYRGWFNQLEPLLNACNASYYNDSACHLDLVQWATDPTWGNLRPAALRKRLLDADRQFLIDQLSNEHIRLLLVNGNGALKQLKNIVDADFTRLEPVVGLGYKDTRLSTSTILNRVFVIAWSTNLQSSRGVTTEQRSEIKKRVVDLAHDFRLA